MTSPATAATAPAHHPLIENLVQGLIALPKDSGDGRYVLSQEGARALEQGLLNLVPTPREFRTAVENLWLFAHYVQEQLASPQLASAIVDILASQPEVRRVAADVSRNEGSDKMGALAEQFNKFTHAQSHHEEEIKTDEPKISAKDLLRNLGMNP